MATIKSYTDLEQSKKLAEILPIESADMFYNLGESKLPNVIYGTHDDFKCYLPCWSLAALLGVLEHPRCFQSDIGILEHPRCFQSDKPTYWFCGCLGKDKLYHEVEADNPIDACCEIILKLHELKML